MTAGIDSQSTCTALWLTESDRLAANSEPAEGCTVGSVVIADAVDTLVRLGAPGLLGVVLGALLSFFAGRRLAEKAHERAVQLLLMQGELDAISRADRALTELRELAHRVRDPNDYFDVQQWLIDEVEEPAHRIRNTEVRRRIRAIHGAITFAWLGPSDPTDRSIDITVSRSIANARYGLEALLTAEPLPPLVYPDEGTLRRLLRLDSGGPNRADLEAYIAWVKEREDVVPGWYSR